MNQLLTIPKVYKFLGNSSSVLTFTSVFATLIPKLSNEILNELCRSASWDGLRNYIYTLPAPVVQPPRELFYTVHLKPMWIFQNLSSIFKHAVLRTCTNRIEQNGGFVKNNAQSPYSHWLMYNRLLAPYWGTFLRSRAKQNLVISGRLNR